VPPDYAFLTTMRLVREYLKPVHKAYQIYKWRSISRMNIVAVG